jgi:hypothetical protein
MKKWSTDDRPSLGSGFGDSFIVIAREKVRPMILNEAHAEDVAAASAAYALGLVEEIGQLPSPEALERLYDLFHTAILAYAECQNGWGLGPEPSVN